MEKIVLRRKGTNRACMRELDIVTSKAAGSNPLADLLLRLFPDSEVSIEGWREHEPAADHTDSCDCLYKIG